jgi:CheY-like chemotaxis protein
MTSPLPASLNILVVEDNDDFRELLCEMLQMLGHSVTSEATGEKALEAVRSVQPDLVISDVTLPGMSGIDLAREIHVLQPSIRIILSSGYGVAIGNQLDFKTGVLSKPYSLDQLTQTLKQVSS